MRATREQIEAALHIARAVAEAIQALGTVPSGELYARLMDKMTINDYNAIIDALKRTKLVSESNYLLTWTGPKS